MTPGPVPSNSAIITSRMHEARSISPQPLEAETWSQKDLPAQLQSQTQSQIRTQSQDRARTQTRAELETETNVALLAIWNRHLPGTRERIAQLDRAATLAADGLLTTPLRTDAAMTAHKLAGSLGTFGFGEGTRIARSIEQLLDDPDAPPAPALLRLTRELRQALPL